MQLVVTLALSIIYAAILWALAKWVGPLPLLSTPSFVQCWVGVITAWVLVQGDIFGFRVFLNTLVGG